MIRRLLDPALGARVRAVLRTLGAFGALVALGAHAEEVAAAITAAQGLLALFVLAPTPPPEG